MDTPRWFMVSSLLMGLLFLVSLFLQYNDPDPLRWMLIYAAAAAVSFLAPWSPIAKRLALIVVIVALAWILFLSPEIAGVISFSDLFLKMNEKGGAVEVGRESGGLAVIVAWMLCCALTRRHST